MISKRKADYSDRQDTLLNSEKIDIPTREEQYELAHRIRENDVEAYHELRNRKRGLVHFQANKFETSSLPLADLIQAGYVGLCRAAKLYNPDKYKTAFSTYALEVIKNEMLGAIESLFSQVKIPNWAPTLLRKIKPELEKYERENREIDTRELSKKYRIGEDTLKKILRLYGTRPVRLFHNRNGGGEGIENTLGELVTYDGSVETEKNRTEKLRESINEACKRRKISERDSGILTQRLGAGLNKAPTLKQLGAQENLSRQRANQIVERTSEKLRNDRILRKEYLDS